MSENKIATNIEDAGPVMAERVATDGDDWRVKITRRPSMAAPQEVVAIFEGATAQQLLSPEPWLQKFSGGSQFYSFRVVHAKDHASDRPTAIYTLPAIPGTPMSPNVKIVSQPGWNGPATITFPADEAPPRNGATKWPASPDSHTGAPRQPAPNADGGSGPSMIVQLQEERARLAEERHRMEMDAVRREAEADRKRLESRLADLATKLDRPAEAKTDPMEVVTKVVAVLAGAITPILPHILSARQTAAQREDDRLRREREDRAETLKLFQAMNEKAAGASADTMKVITPMVDAVAQMGRTVLQQITMMRDLTEPPPQDEGIMGVLKAGIAAWAESQARTGASFFPQPALPQTTAPRTPSPSPSSPASPQVVPVETVMASGQAEDTREVSATEMLDILSNEIRDRADEKDLAEGIVDALQSQEFVEALVSEGGALTAIQKRVGAEWAQDKENVAYIQRLFSLVGQIAASKRVDVRPLFPPAQT